MFVFVLAISLPVLLFAFPAVSFADLPIMTSTITALTNGDRISADLPALADNTILDRAAQMKADDMAAKSYFSHTTPDGKTPWYWFAMAGYSFSYAGENLAVLFLNPKDVEQAWIASPDHRANILGKQYADIGVGVASGMYEGVPTTYVVELFGTPAFARGERAFVGG